MQSMLSAEFVRRLWQTTAAQPPWQTSRQFSEKTAQGESKDTPMCLRYAALANVPAVFGGNCPRRIEDSPMCFLNMSATACGTCLGESKIRYDGRCYAATLAKGPATACGTCLGRIEDSPMCLRQAALANVPMCLRSMSCTTHSTRTGLAPAVTNSSRGGVPSTRERASGRVRSGHTTK